MLGAPVSVNECTTGKHLTASELALRVLMCMLYHSPWAVSSFDKGSTSEEEIRVGAGREAVGVCSAEPSKEFGARGWISAVTVRLLTVVGGEQPSATSA